MTEVPSTFILLRGFYVPDEFWPAFEYTGEARYVFIYWTPVGDEAMFGDGRCSGDANWRAYLMLIEFPPNMQAICEHMPRWALGASDADPTHCLVIDRQEHDTYLALWAEGSKFVNEQWPPQPRIELTPEELNRVNEAFLAAIEQMNAEAVTIDWQALMEEDAQRLQVLKFALELRSAKRG